MFNEYLSKLIEKDEDGKDQEYYDFSDKSYYPETVSSTEVVSINFGYNNFENFEIALKLSDEMKKGQILMNRFDALKDLDKDTTA
jgi:hypothetical protein